MGLLEALPTTREEAWRYSDKAAMAALDLDALNQWQEITLAPDETRTETRILAERQEGVHRIRMSLGAGARAEIFAVLCGDAYSRLEIDVTLSDGAHFELGGVTIGGGDCVREIVTHVHHAHPNATSNQTVRAVHWDKASGNFLGSLHVARDAQKTDAAQNFRAILLGTGASANAVPQLEIFADDVKCAHGCAIGQLDEQAAFYMASRGLAQDAARALLIQAFLADALTGCGNEAEREVLLSAALAKLGTKA